MLRAAFLLLICLLQVSLYAQLSDFVWSTKINKLPTETIKKVIETSNQSVFVFKSTENGKNMVSVDFLDSNFTFLKSEIYKLEDVKVLKVELFNEQIQIFTQAYDPDLKEDLVKVYQLDSTGKLTDGKTLSKLKSRGGYHNSFNISVSPNGKYCSVLCSHAYFEKHAEKVNVVIFEKDFKEIYSAEHSSVVVSRKKRVNHSLINNNGVVYLVKKYRENKMTKYHLILFGNKTGVQHKAIRSKVRKIADMNVCLDSEGALLIGGFYSSPIRKNFEGIFALKFEENTIPSWKKEYQLGEEIIKSFKNKKEINKNGFGLDRFHVKSVGVTNNKDILIIAEHRTVLNNGALVEDYRKGVVVVRLSKNGGFKFVKPILTEQTDAVNAGYWSSYNVTQRRDSTFLYYNKIGGNSSKLKVAKNVGAKYHIGEVSITKEGSSIETYPAFSVDLNEYILMPKFEYDHFQKSLIGFENATQTEYKIGYIAKEK